MTCCQMTVQTAGALQGLSVTKLLQALRLYAQPQRHWLHGLALPRHQQALDIARRRHPPLTAAELQRHGRKKIGQMLGTTLKKRTSPFHARKR